MADKDDMEQMKLPGMGEPIERKIIPFPSDQTRIVFAKFEKEEMMAPEKLFDGFDTLDVITYSYGLGFIEEVSEKFKHMEVIIGNDDLVQGNMFEIIVSSQMSIPICIRQHKKLVERVNQKSAIFYRVNDIISHQKIYLLKSDDGRCRVILGSANFSSVAWKKGRFNQQEDYVVFDNDKDAYSAFYKVFDELKSAYTAPIEERKITNIIETAKEELEELPFINEIIHSNKTALILDEDINNDKNETIYIMNDTIKTLNSLETATNKKFTKSNGKNILVSSENTRTLIKQQKAIREKDIVNMVPKFYINCDIEQAFFNESQFDLTANNMDNLANDIHILLEYFNGYDDFIGTEEEKIQAKKAYYKMFNYILLSPFVAMLRTEAYNTGYAVELFPMFAIIQGKKSAGKSQFIDATRKFMFPNTLFENLVSKDFTQTIIGKYIANVEGIPMHIEDLTETQFNKHASNIIKTETDILNNKIKNHSTYVITTNEVKSLPPAIAKRMYYAHIPLTQKDTTSAKRKKVVTSLLDNITGQLYISYLQRMIPKVNELTMTMENFIPDKTKITKINQPDIFKLSSETLMELFTEAKIDIPFYMGIVTYDNYFGWDNIKDETIEWFQSECLYNPEAFSVNRKQNKLEYSAEPTPERNFGKQAPVEIAYNRFPEELNAKIVGNKVVVNLSMAENYFCVRFKENLFKKGSYKIEILCKNKTE